mgnify:CR=1 FL=1
MPDNTTNQPIVNDVSAPTIEKHTATMATEDSSDQPVAKPDSLVSTNGTTITPDASATEPISSAPDQPNQAPISATDDGKDVKPAAEQPTPAAPPASPYEASDSLPDMSQKMTTEMTNDMQSPRIYDTKEYVVPIHDTMHGHGEVGKVVAAVVSVVIMLAVVIAIAYAVI